MILIAIVVVGSTVASENVKVDSESTLKLNEVELGLAEVALDANLSKAQYKRYASWNKCLGS